MRAEREVTLQKQQQKQRALYKEELAWMRAGARLVLQSNKLELIDLMT